MTQLHSDLNELISDSLPGDARPAFDAPRLCVALTGLNDVPVLTAAAELASVVRGSLFASFIPQQLEPYAYSAFVGPYALPGRFAVDALQEQNQSAEAAARQAFDAVTAERAKQLSGSVAIWRGALGGADELGLSARLMDYVVMIQPRPDASDVAMACLDSVLYRARRSAVLIPPETARFEFSNILIAFNGSAEAAKAVSAAVPILRRALKVFILSIDTQSDGTPNAEELIAYLGSHGVSASAIKSTRRESIEEAVDRFTEELHINLVVMGAYTHAHLRQMIIGGLTTHMIKHAKVPVLVAH